MPGYRTHIKDWKVLLRSSGDFNKGKRKYGYRTLQEGVSIFGRKKKFGCKLISSADVRRDQKKVEGLPDKVRIETRHPNGCVERRTVNRVVMACKYGFRKILLKEVKYDKAENK